MAEQAKYITISEALEAVTDLGMGEVTAQTIRNWAVKYKFGYKFGSRWRIDRKKLEAFLKGAEKPWQRKKDKWRKRRELEARWKKKTSPSR